MTTKNTYLPPGSFSWTINEEYITNPCAELFLPSKNMSQAQFISAIRTRQLIIGSCDPVTGYVSFSSNPILHSNVNSARTECKRLAVLHPGKLYFFVELSGAELVPNNTVSI